MKPYNGWKVVGAIAFGLCATALLTLWQGPLGAFAGIVMLLAGTATTFKAWRDSKAIRNALEQ
jgi:hypothetical protein